MRLTTSLASPIGCLAALSAVAGCGKQPSAEAGSAAVPDVAAAEPDAPPDGVEDLLDARAVAYLDRYPGLSDDHRRRLAQDGFFLAPTGAPALFHVYQRNERLGLPSFVTTDLALEILLAVVASVRNDVETQSAAPDLYECLHAMLRRGLEIRGRSAGDPRSAREALDRAIVVVAVAAHLLGAEGSGRDAAQAGPRSTGAREDAEAHAAAGRAAEAAPLAPIPWPDLPAGVGTMFEEAVSRVRVADGEHSTTVLRRPVDFGAFRIAGQAPPGRARALARTLLWLGVALGADGRCEADPAVAALVARMLADAGISGERNLAALPRGSAGVRGAVRREAPNSPPVQATRRAPDLWRRICDTLTLLGRRGPSVSFAEAEAFFERRPEGGFWPPAAAAATLLAFRESGLGFDSDGCVPLPLRIGVEACPGCSDAARWLGPAPPRIEAGSALLRSRAERRDAGAAAWLPAARSERWAAAEAASDLWTRAALGSPPRLPPPGSPPPEDCEPTAAPAPPSVVAPYPEFFAAALATLEEFAADLARAGIVPAAEIEAPRGPAEEIALGIQEKLGAARQFLRVLRDVTTARAAGRTPDDVQREALARIGTWAEAILADAAGADSIGGRTARWIHRDPKDGPSTEFAGVDAVYVVVDAGEGPVLARGAVYSAWAVEAARAAPAEDGEAAPGGRRPEWLAPAVADAVPPPPLLGDGVRRCMGPDSGGDMEL